MYAECFGYTSHTHTRSSFNCSLEKVNNKEIPIYITYVAYVGHTSNAHVIIISSAKHEHSLTLKNSNNYSLIRIFFLCQLNLRRFSA